MNPLLLEQVVGTNWVGMNTYLQDNPFSMAAIPGDDRSFDECCINYQGTKPVMYRRDLPLIERLTKR